MADVFPIITSAVVIESPLKAGKGGKRALGKHALF
jgi:hypothetical protein